MSPQHEKNVERLLVKILGELRDLNARVGRIAGEPIPETPRSGADVVSVNRGIGRPAIVSDSAADTPSALTPEMREAQRAQPDPRRVSPAFVSDAVRLSDEQLRAWGRKPEPAAKITDRPDPAPIREPVPGRSGRV